MSIRLYVTSACTLCDEALDMLLESQPLAGKVLQVVDIANDDALLLRWSDKIPVLEIGGDQLVWPFAVADVVQLLNRE
ncbi:MAG: glutaredoxin family protein [Gammaproteobacteria bacterium]|nr:glutaredoxin family protein [Gammaproteobacteria bacterium]